VDRRISPAERDRLPAICADGQLAAVWRLGVSEEFLPVGESCRFIQITKEENEYEK
jgi:tRNA(Ile)-lysidine synthase